MNQLIRDVQPVSEIHDEQFKTAMRHLVGGVAIITAGQDEIISGMTVTSLTALSAAPPRLMVGVNRTASSFPLITRHAAFGVSIPRADQFAVASRFGNGKVPGRERFAGAEWITLSTGAPLLANALAVFDCRVEEIIERHSHAIIIGEPIAILATEPAAGLGYWHGSYAAVGRTERLRSGG